MPKISDSPSQTQGDRTTAAQLLVIFFSLSLIKSSPACHICQATHFVGVARLHKCIIPCNLDICQPRFQLWDSSNHELQVLPHLQAVVAG